MNRPGRPGVVTPTIVTVVLLTTLLPSHVFADQEQAPVPVLRNVRVGDVLVAVFDELLQSSPTFREQCERIEQARYLRVIVTAVMSQSTTSRGTARTTFRRYAAGALIATVEIPAPLQMTDYAELFGHEFEHILEQLDRVDLHELARSGEARRLADGAFETRRARSAGQLISIEFEHPGLRTASSTIPATAAPARPTTPNALLKQ